MRKILKLILRILAKRTLLRYRPIVIGITGSVGKTLAKEAIYAVLKKRYFVWRSKFNYNNEIGVPLAILGVSPVSPGHGRIRVLYDLVVAGLYAFGPRRLWYPRYIVLEMAADRPGDIAYLAEMTKPQIGVITAIGEVPVHVENYDCPESLAREKEILLRVLPSNGFAVINADDPIVADMASSSKAPVMTFGFSKNAGIRAADISYFLQDDKVGGLSFRVIMGDTLMPFRLPNIFAIHQLYGILAAVAVGAHLGMNLVEISDALEVIELPVGRMAVLRGKNGTTVIDDSYNASPLSMRAALDTLRQYPGKRRIAILGEMAELGNYAEKEHMEIAEYANKIADIVITIGKSWKDGYFTIAQALLRIKEIIQEGDIILVKGSRITHLEHIVDAIKEKP